MKVSADIVVQSHLSDSLIEMHFDTEQTSVRIRFVKWLILELDGNLNQLIDPDELFEKFNSIFNP